MSGSPVADLALPVPPLTRESCDCQTADGCFYRDGRAALAAFAIEEDEAPLSLALCLMFLVIYRILAYGMFYYRGEPPSAATFVVECAGQVAELCHLNFACALTRALRRGVLWLCTSSGACV